jgi:hypothetical protein
MTTANGPRRVPGWVVVVAVALCLAAAALGIVLTAGRGSAH